MKIVDFDESKLLYPNHPKVKSLIDNEEEYIAELKAMPDKVLARKLENVRIQKQWAYDQQKWVELESLCLFEYMIIAARILRFEENPNRKEYDEPDEKPRKKKEKKKTVNEENQNIEENILDVPDEDNNNDTPKNDTSKQLTLFDLDEDF